LPSDPSAVLLVDDELAERLHCAITLALASNGALTGWYDIMARPALQRGSPHVCKLDRFHCNAVDINAGDPNHRFDTHELEHAGMSKGAALRSIASRLWLASHPGGEWKYALAYKAIAALMHRGEPAAEESSPDDESPRGAEPPLLHEFARYQQWVYFLTMKRQEAEVWSLALEARSGADRL